MHNSLRIFALKVGSAVVVATSLATLAGCGGGNSTSDIAPPPLPDSMMNINLMPKVINAAVTTSLETHTAITPSPNVPAANKLFVFLPGTGAVPTEYKLILTAAAAKGLHAIGVNYPNPTPVGVICRISSDDPNCFWNVHREIVSGTDDSADVATSKPDAIVTRLTDALEYLNRNFPDQGWGVYLRGDGTVDWSKVVLSGHSQGGGLSLIHI